MARSLTTMCFSALRSQLACLPRLCRTGAAAWVTVLTVLFCAVLPAGLPQSATYGSAFNPATTSVALAARAPERRTASVQRLRPDRPPAPALSAVAAVPPTVLPSPRPDADITLLRVAPATLHTQALARLGWARDPPAA
ncbi:hypothetical protein [Sphingomonas sp. S2-65]|uniref:hypothetical protein n=1 Tax=Sphingomonas sp. S2-65 TaxID=2903960 RepID=UPI001F34B70B|nr:hypothetical protein [Sphingomonas sp. S2-65]UYY59844.1 hypothetical protein LZ586_07090 [Sphingomonas sp. S2-65]